MAASRQAGARQPIPLTVSDILLTHGYFLSDDEKEQQIMTRAAVLDIVRHAKACGFSALRVSAIGEAQRV